MKYLLVLLLLSSLAKADTKIEIMGGGLVYHPQDPPAQVQKYANQSGNGLISPILGGLRLDFNETKFYTAYSIFGGQDSFANRIIGGSFSVGVPFKYLELGILVGVYGRSFQVNMEATGEPTIMPMMGIETNLVLSFSETIAIKANTLVSFQLISGLLSLAINI